VGKKDILLAGYFLSGLIGNLLTSSLEVPQKWGPAAKGDIGKIILTLNTGKKPIKKHS